MMLDHMTNTGNGTRIKIEKGTILVVIQIGIMTVLIQTLRSALTSKCRNRTDTNHRFSHQLLQACVLFI